MGRKHTAGSVGNQAVGGVQVDNTSLSAADNLDIIIDPSGTGIFKIAGDAQLEGQGDLRFADADSSNWVAFQAPSTVAANVTWTLPATDGSSNQTLATNGSGTLSWTSPAIALSDNTSDSATNYLAFVTATSGSATAARVSSTGLTFQPSTSTLTTAGPVVSRRTENIRTTNYVLALTDRNIAVTMNNTSAATVTIPNDTTANFPDGSVVYIARVNTGTVTLAGEGGVTLSKTGLFGANEEIIVRKRTANTWIVIDSQRSLTGSGGTTTTPTGFSLHQFTTTGAGTFTVS
jgi:hypothetical protein